MTHEIRNSITPIASLSADLLKHLDPVPISRQREGLEVVNSQAKNLTAFLDSYHRLTHLPEPEYKTVTIQALFTKLERLLQAEPGSERIVYSGGSGIGLPISQRIMQLHGGQLSVLSIQNVRTTFKMEF